jgi:hypothetical protein
MTTPTNKVETGEMSEAEAEEAFGDDAADGVGDRMGEKLSHAIEGVPEWASIPPNFAIPPGKRLGWMRFRSEWTDAPMKGDRWCMMWPLSEAEEKIAYKRSNGDASRAIAELTKASIRLIDGAKVDRTGASGPGNVAIFWAEVGTKMRQMLQNYYLKTHTLTPEEQQDFFANCFVVTTAVAG